MFEEKSIDMAKGVTWNLDDLYQGDDDPALYRDLRAVRDKAQAFVTSYKNKINEKDLDARTLLSAIKEYESIHEMGMKPYTFAYLYQSSDVQDQTKNRLFEKVRREWNEISQLLLFFLLQIMVLPESFLKRLANHNALTKYRHFLLQLIERKPYTLSEPEERIIKNKNLSGRNAIVSLYGELMASLSIPVEIEGKRRLLTADQVLAFLHWPDRSLREKVFQTFLQELSRHEMVFKNMLNALVLDHHLETMKRGHPSPMHGVALSHGVDEGLIETMMEEVEENYPLAQRYFRLKARLLGTEKLKSTDILAPVKKEGIQASFSEAKQFLMEALEDLHPLFHSMGHEFFEKEWIDAEIRKGKRSGAFGKCLAPPLHPFVSLNYTGNLRDMAILAHELGHGIHYMLAAGQSYLNFDPSPIFAETASTFNEIIFTRHLMKRREFQVHLPALLASHLEGILITVFRQNVLTRFEQNIYRARHDHLLGEEEICQLWWKANARLYGEDVEMVPAYRWGWIYIPHFIHRPFYCYSYVFGNLLSMILYQNYQDKGKAFLEKIVHLFASGSSQAPMEMLEEMELNPGQQSFWDQAFQYVKGLIDLLEMF